MWHWNASPWCCEHRVPQGGARVRRTAAHHRTRNERICSVGELSETHPGEGAQAPLQPPAGPPPPGLGPGLRWWRWGSGLRWWRWGCLGGGDGDHRVCTSMAHQRVPGCAGSTEKQRETSSGQPRSWGVFRTFMLCSDWRISLGVINALCNTGPTPGTAL